MKGATVLVAGGCGFIGSNLVRRLVDKGARCIVIDNLSTGEPHNLPRTNDVKLHSATILDKVLLQKLVSQSDYVVNLAAVNIMRAQEDPHLDLEVNAQGALLLAQLVAKTPRVKRLVYASSASVYGNPEMVPVPETARTSPMSHYAVSKLAGEQYTVLKYLLDDAPTCAVRYSNVYGPYQRANNPYCGVVGKFIASALDDEVVRIYGHGLQTRDFTYVDDAVEATLLALESPKADGEVFNVASGHEITIRQVAEAVFAAVDKPPIFEFVNRRDIDNISRRALNIEKARMRLKWEPRHTIEEGIKKTVQWFTETWEARLDPVSRA